MRSGVFFLILLGIRVEMCIRDRLRTVRVTDLCRDGVFGELE